jgi:hypothetical protein
MTRSAEEETSLVNDLKLYRAGWHSCSARKLLVRTSAVLTKIYRYVLQFLYANTGIIYILQCTATFDAV